MRYDGNGKQLVQTPQRGKALRKMFERQFDEELKGDLSGLEIIRKHLGSPPAKSALLEKDDD